MFLGRRGTRSLSRLIHNWGAFSQQMARRRWRAGLRDHASPRQGSLALALGLCVLIFGEGEVPPEPPLGAAGVAAGPPIPSAAIEGRTSLGMPKLLSGGGR